MVRSVRKAPPRPTSLAELLALPNEGQGYEIVDGELVEKETSGEHSRAQSRVSRMLGPTFDRRTGGRRPGGWWFATEALIDFGGARQFRPDVAGWRRERLTAPPSGKVLTVIPDWICEIISPSNAANDTVTKMRAYQQAQVGHCWLIDPFHETLAVYRWTAEGYLHVVGARCGDRVRAEPFGAIELQVGVFFGDDEEDEPNAE